MKQRRNPNEFDLALLDYELPASLIAQHPAARREEARLLVVGPGDALTDSRISELPGILKAGDLLILNDTRVVRARFFLQRQTGGRVEGLFLHELSGGWWQVLLKNAGRCHVGESLRFLPSPGSALATEVAFTARLQERCEEGHWVIEVTPAEPAAETLEAVGVTPLPPYIARERPGAARVDAAQGHAVRGVADEESLDRQRYQTVYARSPGAVAAPTAGLHFTDELLAKLEKAGIGRAFVTLHVGEGTFKPITAPTLADHEMHHEMFELPPRTVEAVDRCRRAGGRVVAVGTTSVRVLESRAQPVLSPQADPSVQPDTELRPGGAWSSDVGPLSDCGQSSHGSWPHGRLLHGRGLTNLLIYPPYSFACVDLLLTNFHLPRSTLLALVMALGGVERIRRAYAHAVERGYRFYSFGDAMLVLPG
ncbi:MAG: S-adenosylmethionine:tRNA ribosyltransferase-isomerase [Phycisphaerales bacterium]|nr:S-adenosylmethionine:tRNA ribosyltransferase-isomerase [Phycisphaerales bacterium]